uniref:Pecanex-like protein n=1 Tax=Ascaris lumbricoides TaxID=6252 RepID=A0A0M3IPY0_ASCLU
LPYSSAISDSAGVVGIGEGLCVGGLCAESHRTTGSSVSSTSLGLPPNNTSASGNDSISPQSKSATLESTTSSVSTVKSQHSTPKKHSVILRPFLKKKTKRSTSKSERCGGAGANAGKEEERVGEDNVMKRSASPTLPEGATQPKNEAPPTCNGQPANSDQRNNVSSIALPLSLLDIHPPMLFSSYTWRAAAL